MSRWPAVLFLLVVLPTVGAAQPRFDSTYSDSLHIHHHLDHLLDTQGTSPQSGTIVAERLTRLARNPLDLNSASAAALRTVPHVSSPLAHRIVQYRDTDGPFTAVSDLEAIPAVDRSLRRAMEPYLVVRANTAKAPSDSTVSPSVIISDLDVDVIQRLTRDVRPGRGFDTDSSRTTAVGSPEGLTTRLRITHDRHVQLALTLDKDPGEPLHWDPATQTYGADHIAGNLTLRDAGPLQTLVLGDFSAQFGQGLALWQGLTFGKGRDPISPLVRDGRGLVPFQSTNEHRFFRGVGTTVELTSNVSVSAFGSRRLRDATLDSTVTEEADAEPIPARTLSTSGRHRTPGERRRKGAFGTTTVGGALEYRTGRVQIGATGYQSWFDRPLRPPQQPYRRFDVAGTTAASTSLFSSIYLDEYTLFGEAAWSSSSAIGALAGVRFTPTAGVEGLVLGRHYPRSFAGLFNGGIGESSDTQNETGIYAGVRVQATEQWRMAAYVDQYRFPWLRFGVPRPSTGFDSRFVLDYEPRPWLTTSVQVRTKRNETGTTSPDAGQRSLSAIAREWRHSARWKTKYDFTDSFTLRTRLHVSRFTPETGQSRSGVLIAQGLRYAPNETLRLDARLALFDTDGFDTRIYTYEHDLLYSFSVPAFFDRGQRSYILARYRPLSAVSIEAKYGVTWYPTRSTVGSGLRKKNQNRSRELRFQIRWRY